MAAAPTTARRVVMVMMPWALTALLGADVLELEGADAEADPDIEALEL